MRVVFFGHRMIAAEVLGALPGRGFELAAVVTHDPAAHPADGAWFAEAARIAAANGAPLLQPAKLAGSAEFQRIERSGAELWVVVGYLELLTAEMLAVPPRGALNFHAALLPRYRGRAPLSRALMNGERTVGATVHYIDPGMDSGDIVLQATREVSDDDTVVTLYDWAMAACPGLMLGACDAIASGRAGRRPQREEEALAFAELTARDRLIHWERPAARIFDHVRALVHPWPGALTHYRGEELIVWRAEKPERRATRDGADPGRILSSTPSGGALVATGEGEIRITDVELVGKPGRVPAGELLRRPGVRLGLDVEGRLRKLEARLDELERLARGGR